MAMTAKTYYPIDGLLDMPRVRILRALRWFDWVTQDDIRIALNEENVFNLARNLKTLSDEGKITRVGSRGAMKYRLAAAGRRELARLLRRAEIRP